MTRTLKALFSGGVLKPLENLALIEGQEVTIFLEEPNNTQAIDESIRLCRENAGQPTGKVDSAKEVRQLRDERMKNL